MNPLFTIGHSNHPPEEFIRLLQIHGIEAVYDLRSQPFSRFRPHFNREALTRMLRGAGIGYVYLGDKLGGRPDDPGAYIDGHVSYPLQAQTPVFQEGLTQLRVDARSVRLAIMCAEKDPLNCHRTWSVAENLPEMEIVHILADGRLETHAATMARATPRQRQLL